VPVSYKGSLIRGPSGSLDRGAFVSQRNRQLKSAGQRAANRLVWIENDSRWDERIVELVGGSSKGWGGGGGGVGGGGGG